MTTIPASHIAQVTPNVLAAGGSALDMITTVLTTSNRVPIGTIQSFGGEPDVSAFFGPGSKEDQIATEYFGGFLNSDKLPGSINFTQFPVDSVPAYIRGGPVNQLSLTQLQALSGTLTVVMDGYTHSGGTINLNTATSFSSAASIIQTALNGSEPTEASVTGSIAAGTASFTGSIAEDILTVTAITSGQIVIGGVLTGSGVAANTQVVDQLTGNPGGVGTYAVSILQTVASGTITESFGTLTVTAVTSGNVAAGQAVSGTGVTTGTQVTALGTGTGGTGTYIVNLTQTVTSESLTLTAVAVSVSFDSVSGGFIITSGISGLASTSTFPTGTLAASIFLTSATGAVLSQGAIPQTPSVFMDALTSVSQNWALFMTAFDPDGGSGNAQKQLFAQWANSKNNRYGYVAWDTDASPTTGTAPASLGAIIASENLSGTFPIYEPTDLLHAAFVCGIAASIDFDKENGRTNFAFRTQTGLVAAVTSGTVADNLEANGYNYVGVFATAAQNFTFLYPGSVSGPFKWMDSFINQIWLNNGLQLAMVLLLTTVKSIPYNAAGDALIEAALSDPINAALSFGAIRPGVTLSAAQIADVNNAAGKQIDNVLSTRGWYLLVGDASPAVRAARGSPPCTLWYVDGQSVQQINLTSIQIQ